MANEVWAAIIQAIPIGAAALVGWRGLSTWRTQLRESRQVKHAERALAAADPMFNAIRLARSRQSTLPAEQTASSAGLKTAVRHDIEERLNRAWSAFARFQERYALARLYITHEAQHETTDVSAEAGNCLHDLTQHAKWMWAYEDAGERKLNADQRIAF